MKLIFIGFLSVLTLFSCNRTNNKLATITADDSKPVPATPSKITDVVWYLKSMTLAGKKIPITRPITLNITNGKITGHGGCNRYFGRFTGEGERISLDQIGSSRMFCKDASKLESQYLEALGKVNGARLGKEGELGLAFPKGILLFSNTPVKITGKSATTKIQGVLWHLQSISKDGVTQRAKGDVTLLLSKNKMTGTGGCNGYSANYTQKGSRFDVKGIAASEMYCKKYGEQEAQYFRALETVYQQKVDDNLLILLYSKGELVFKK